ncbi:MAG: hypothetical protein U0794_15295 [Isosphaeraceae bacterium]
MAERTDRRRFLNTALAGSAGAGAFLSFEEKILGAAIDGGVAPAPGEAGYKKATTPVTPAAPAYTGEPLARGRLGRLEVGRLILGGNLIGGWAHSRDLLYVSSLLRAYNTETKVFETLALAERSGITMIQVDPACFGMIERYRKEHGGRIQTMVCIHPDPDDAKVSAEINDLVGRGADALYTHGEVSDRCTRGGDLKTLARAVALIRKAGVPAGIGSHSLETPIAAESHDLGAEYYVKTFHPDTYWSATPKERREEWCWYGPRGTDHDSYNDNMFCIDPERTEAFMKSVRKPWVAFKVMAAGALRPEVGFNFAFRRGADFVIAGMFDFQIAQDVEHAVKALQRSRTRERPWMA